MTRRAYLTRIIIVAVISLVLCCIKQKYQLSIVPMPQNNIVNYHVQVLTISSVFCGFSLTNLTLLLEVHSEEMAKKLEGTDILQKRNKSISYSIMYGAIAAFLAVLWVLHVNIEPIKKLIGIEWVNSLKDFLFNVEIISLMLCIICFMISSKKMIDLISILNKPKNKISNEKVNEYQKRINGNN